MVSGFGLAHQAGTADDKEPAKLNPAETPDDKASEKLSGWQKLFRKQSAEYIITTDSADSASLQLVKDPILNWSQPVRGGAEGAVFVWTQDGRPLAIGTMFIYPMDDGKNQGVVHELHSLSTTPLVGKWHERVWTPPKDSVTWTTLSDVAPPGESPEQRLRQMRDLARSFNAESYDKKTGARWELRLLPRPIFRYDTGKGSDVQAADREMLDGALFGFIEGTDLEIVLLLQARRTTAGTHWEFALARMSDYRLVVRRQEKTVWEVPKIEFYDNSRLAYYCSRVEIRESPDDP
jgi:hypothetical protein